MFFLILVNSPPFIGAVEKVNFLCYTPIPIAPDSYRDGTPRGDLMKSSDIESPPWGVWG